jgi:hypothetical protein
MGAVDAVPSIAPERLVCFPDSVAARPSKILERVIAESEQLAPLADAFMPPQKQLNQAVDCTKATEPSAILPSGPHVVSENGKSRPIFRDRHMPSLLFRSLHGERP